MRNIKNPSEGVSQPFVIMIFYDNQPIQKTESNILTGRTVTVTKKSQFLDVTEIDFNPRNEGEISTYIFKFIPTTILSDKYQIVFKFPDAYGYDLGSDISCKSLAGLIAEVYCSATNRMVTVSGLTNYDPLTAAPI